MDTSPFFMHLMPSAMLMWMDDTYIKELARGLRMDID